MVMALKLGTIAKSVEKPVTDLQLKQWLSLGSGLKRGGVQRKRKDVLTLPYLYILNFLQSCITLQNERKHS